MRTFVTITATLLATALCLAQGTGGGAGSGGGAVGGNDNDEKTAQDLQLELLQQRREDIAQAERDGVEVRIKDIARFRGHRVNMLSSFGLVVGLAGTGDSQQTPFAATLLKNALEQWGTIIDATKFRPKNVAVVAITAELPPYAAPGNMIDITVSSFGDAKSLEGGTLLLTPLYGPADNKTVIAVAQGSVSIGGFNASSGGSSQTKNHANVGRIPSGAIVEMGVPTQTIFDGSLFIELYLPDITTSQRVATALGAKFPEFFVTPIDGGTIEIKIPDGFNEMLAMSQIEQSTVFADIPAVVVVNERTGTIVIGGNVKLGPAVIAHGSLQVRIEAYPFVSQPNSFTSGGTTVAGTQTYVDVSEGPTQIGVIPPSTTINDLARILQTLQVSARDIIAILQALSQSGALKARIRIQ